MVDGTRQDLANEIRRIRTALKMTLKEFGAKVGVSEATVSRWESAKHIPESEFLDAIARLQKKASHRGGGFLARYMDLRERERMSSVVGGVQDTVRIGSHEVQLLADGAILINGKIRINPEEPTE